MTPRLNEPLLVTIAIVTAVALVLTACDNEAKPPPKPKVAEIAKVVQPHGVTLTDAPAEVREDQREFARAATREMDSIREGVVEVKRVALGTRADSNANLKSRIQDVEHKWNVAEMRVAQLKDRRGDEWKDLRDDVHIAVAELREAYRRVYDELQRS